MEREHATAAIAEKLERLLVPGEQWLMHRVLEYAQEYGYTAYASTLEEAWRLSINGLTGALIESARVNANDLELRCEADWSEDPAAHFGVEEARKHRARGIPFEMFLSLMKYYSQAYVDLCKTLPDREDASACERAVTRYFDRVEIAFSSEWAGLGANVAVAELQQQSRELTSEKVRYITVFESLNVPVVLLDEHGMVDNINEAAAATFGTTTVSGSAYYSRVGVGAPFEPLRDEIAAFLGGDRAEREFERRLDTAVGERFFVVRLKRMPDISGRLYGCTVVLHDVTARKRTEDEALESRAQYRALFENMVDAFAQHVAVRDGSGAIVDYRFAEVNQAFEDLFGFASADVVGRLANDIWPPGNELCLA